VEPNSREYIRGAVRLEQHSDGVVLWMLFLHRERPSHVLVCGIVTFGDQSREWGKSAKPDSELARDFDGIAAPYGWLYNSKEFQELSD